MHTPLPPHRRSLPVRAIAALLTLAFLTAGCTVTPDPLTREEIEKRATDDYAAIESGRDRLDGTPISLYDAIARALKYNLDHRLKIMEQALANQQLDLAHYDLLPKVTAQAGYTTRDEYDGSSSMSLLDGSESLVTSTSTEKDIRTADISIMWNVLDFGVSYARAKQRADKVLILEERRRKVIQNIIQDVRYAYWRAVSAERLMKDMYTLLDRTKAALKRSRQIAAQQLQPPKKTLEYQKALLENVRLLYELIQRLAPARVELASLMNLPPGARFSLTDQAGNFPEVTSFNLPLPEMEKMALMNRPELREEDYKGRISAEDVRKSLLRMLPGLRFDLGYNYDSNKFLYTNDWWNAGAAVSQNIVDLIAGPKRMKAARAQTKIDEMRRKAVSMAVLVQVHLAYQRLAIARKEYVVARHLDSLNREIYRQTAAALKEGGADELTAIKSATNSLVALMRHYNAYAEVQNAVGRLYNSMGIDLMPDHIEANDVKHLATAIEQSITAWRRRMEGHGKKIAARGADDPLDIATVLGPAAPAPKIDYQTVPRPGTDKKIPAEKTAAVTGKDVLDDQSLDDTGAERIKIKMRSAQLHQDVLRDRVIEDSDLMPVAVRLISTGLVPAERIHAAPAIPQETGVAISITSPLAAPVYHRR